VPSDFQYVSADPAGKVSDVRDKSKAKDGKWEIAAINAGLEGRAQAICPDRAPA
jgi:hypothetical protein